MFHLPLICRLFDLLCNWFTSFDFSGYSPFPVGNGNSVVSRLVGSDVSE